MTIDADTCWIELDGREADGLEVRLLWNPGEDLLKVVVDDDRMEESFEIPAPRDRALEVFNHPFVYA